MFALVAISIAVFMSCCCAFNKLVLNHEAERDVEQKTDEQAGNGESYQDPTNGGRPASAPSEPMRGERDSDLKG